MQRFYRLRDTGEFLVVDFVLFRRSDPLLFSEVERVETPRLLHCPQRCIFGLRYLARDLPADVRARIEVPAFVRDLDDLAMKQDQARCWFEPCMARLQLLGPGSGLPEPERRE